MLISVLVEFEDAKKVSYEVRLLTEKTFPKKESTIMTSPDPHRTSSSPVRPNQSVSLGEARRKASSPMRKDSAPKKIIVEEEIKSADEVVTKSTDKKDKKKEKEKKPKNFDESLREPLLNEKKKNKKDKKSKKKSKKEKNDEGGKENKCCSCF
jgi:hypothetical protein